MNRLSKLFVFVAAFASFSAFAANQQDPAEQLSDCTQIVAACQAAGFTYAGHDATGKGLWIDCIQKIQAGNSVAGVSGFTRKDAYKCMSAKKAAGY